MSFVTGLGIPTGIGVPCYYMSGAINIGPPCSDGMDVSFIVDYTGSMGTIINSVKTSIAGIATTIDTMVDPAKKYRLSLTLADEQTLNAASWSYSARSEYTSLPSAQRLSIDGTTSNAKEILLTAMEVFQDNNVSTLTTQLAKINNTTGNNLPLGFGWSTPEPTDLATWGNIATDSDGTTHPWYANQGAWRVGVVRLNIIFSDAPPSGTDDIYDAADVKSGIDLATLAKINETRILRFGPNVGGGAYGYWLLLAQQTDGAISTNYNETTVNDAIIASCQEGNIPYTTTNMTNYSFRLGTHSVEEHLKAGDEAYYTMPQTNASTRSMSVSFWIKPDNGNIQNRIYATKGGSSSNGKEWEIGADGSNKLFWKIYDDVNSNFIQIIEDQPRVLSVGAWQHICCTWDGTVANGNGLVMYHTTAAGTTSIMTATNTTATASITGTMDVVGDTGEDLLFGKPEGGTGYVGLMADISYWNLALNQSQVALISNGGSQQVNVHSLYNEIDMNYLVAYWRALKPGASVPQLVYGYKHRNIDFVNAVDASFSTDIS